MKPLKQVIAKGKNKRINIFLIEDSKGNKAFLVYTKTLVDFKTRNILSTSTSYSVETFAVLRDIFSSFLDDAEVKNKLIHKELSRIHKFSGSSDLRSLKENS